MGILKSLFSKIETYYSRPGLLPYLLINGTFYETIEGTGARVAGGYLLAVAGPVANLLTRYAQDMAW
jgi:hypothetical protein